MTNWFIHTHQVRYVEAPTGKPTPPLCHRALTFGAWSNHRLFSLFRFSHFFVKGGGEQFTPNCPWICPLGGLGGPHCNHNSPFLVS